MSTTETLKNEALQRAIDLLNEEIAKENPFHFQVRLVNLNAKTSFELEDYFRGRISVSLRDSVKITNHSEVQVEYLKISRKKYSKVKVKKREYPLLQKYFKIIFDAFIQVVELEKKRGIVVVFSPDSFDEGLASSLSKVSEVLNPEQYGEEMKKLVENKLNQKIIGMHVDSIDKEQEFIAIVPKLRDIFNNIPLLTFEHRHKDNILSLFDEEVCVKYAGEIMNIKLFDNDRITIHHKEDDTKKDLPLDKEIILQYLNEVKEEQKLKHLIKKPMDNFQQLVSKLRFVEELTKGTGIKSFWIRNEKELETEFEKLEQHFKSWERAESVFKELLEKREKGEFQFFDFKNIYNKSSETNICMYEFNHLNMYFYFIFSKKWWLSSESRDQMQLLIANEQEPLQLKTLIYDLLTNK